MADGDADLTSKILSIKEKHPLRASNIPSLKDNLELTNLVGADMQPLVSVYFWARVSLAIAAHVV